MFNAAFKVEDSNNFEIKEILNYANCGQLFEGGIFLIGGLVLGWFVLGICFLFVFFLFSEREKKGEGKKRKERLWLFASFHS